MSTTLPAPGELVEPQALCLPKAQDLVRTLQSERLAFVRYVESRREADGTEIVVLDVEVERGQRSTHDIRPLERIAVRFFAGDTRIPEVLALREDFPLVPHLNLRDTAPPQSLCLFDEPYDDIKLRWTAAGLVERLRSWLALTARGELHAPDQPLEPLLLGYTGTLVIPPELLNGTAPRLLLSLAVSSTGHHTYIAVPDRGQGSAQMGACVVTLLEGQPQPHGIIQRRPSTLFELHRFLEAAGVDTLGDVRDLLRQWHQDGSLTSVLDVKLAVVVTLPKTRDAGATIEAADRFAFVTTCPISKLGEAIGIWQMHGAQPGFLVPTDVAQCGEKVELVLLNPVMAFSQAQAALLNKRVEPKTLPIAVVGVGALGSQVVASLMRMGYGPWTTIDKDILLPHNLGRNAFTGYGVGYAKADIMAQAIIETLGTSSAARSLPVDVIHPGDKVAELETALADADVIVDMSASVAVARALALDHATTARRISLFLNPSGTDVVLLAEDARRTIPLDMLEMQYYQLLNQDERLAHHLRIDGLAQRIGRSCRDVSLILEQDQVALLAAVGSRAIRHALEQKAAQISVWRSDGQQGTVERIDAPPTQVVVNDVGGWAICVDGELLKQLHDQRKAQLPNETGGVLLGALDLERKRIYVVDSLPSPRDSVEWPTLYIRGCDGLAEKVTIVEQRTAWNVSYVGEWHSHPAGVPATPSRADRQVLRWLADARGVEGLPGVMAIVSDDQCSWFLEELALQ